MQRTIRTTAPLTRSVAALALSLVAGACATTSQSASIQQVDDLVTRVEEIHGDARAAKESVYEAILALRPVVTPAAGQPMTLFEGFLTAVDASDASAQSLAASIGPMEQSARRVFAKWERDLIQFESESLRARSRDRMESTRASYKEVLQAAQAAHEAHVGFNAALHDITLFLAHDYNAAAIGALQTDATALRERAKELGRVLERCMVAADSYVKQVAPVGVAIVPVAPPTAGPAKQ